MKVYFFAAVCIKNTGETITWKTERLGVRTFCLRAYTTLTCDIGSGVDD